MNTALKNKLRQALNNGKGSDHLSYTQLFKPLSDWNTDYLARDETQRRSDKKKYKLHFGSTVGNIAQKLRSQYLFHKGKRITIKERDRNKISEEEYKTNLFYNPFDEKDKTIREMLVDSVQQQVDQTLKAIKEIFGNAPLMSERYTYTSPQDLFADIVGRIDYESPDIIAEQKTKPNNVKFYKATKNKEERFSLYQQTLPEEPNVKNVEQLSFYWKSTNKKPFLFYVNDEGYKIFDDSHEMLKPDYLEYCYQKLLDKAFTIQRLLIISEGDPVEFAKYCEPPDLTHWSYADVSNDKLETIKKLWRM